MIFVIGVFVIKIYNIEKFYSIHFNNDLRITIDDKYLLI